MKWLKRTPPTEPEFVSQQDRLSKLTGELLERYRREMNAEINDPDRLAEVYGTEFAGSEAQSQAQTVATMASQMLKVPGALITIVLPDRQVTIAAEGVATTDISIEDSYCSHVIGTGREFAVNNSPEHPLVCDTSFARDGTVVSYLGVPIANYKGIVIGVLCVFDTVERHWTAADVGMLTQLSFVLTRATAKAAATR